MKIIRTFAALAVAGCLMTPTAQAGLIGDSVQLAYDFTGLPSTLDTFTVGSGVEVTCPGSANVCSLLTAPTQTVDFADLSITYTYTGNGSGFNALPENRFRFLSLDPGFAIGTVGLTTNIGGLDASRISFTSNSITVNVSGLGLSGPTSNFQLTLAPVPEPATWAMLLLGLMGINALVVRRRVLPL